MVFSSSPELNDGSEVDGIPGAPLLQTGVGGKLHDAGRLAQLEAIRQAGSEEVAKRQAAVENEQREKARQHMLLQTQRRALEVRKRRQREDMQSFTCFFIVAIVLVVLATKAYACMPTSMEWRPAFGQAGFEFPAE